MKASEARDLANKLRAHDQRILEKVYSQVKELLYDGYQLEAIDRIGYRISWYNR